MVSRAINRQDCLTRRSSTCALFEIARLLHNEYAATTCTFSHELGAVRQHHHHSITQDSLHASATKAHRSPHVFLPSSMGDAPLTELRSSSHSTATLTQGHPPAPRLHIEDKEEGSSNRQHTEPAPLLVTQQYVSDTSKQRSATLTNSEGDTASKRKDDQSLNNGKKSSQFNVALSKLPVPPVQLHTAGTVTEASSALLQKPQALPGGRRNATLLRQPMAFNGNDIDQNALLKALATRTGSTMIKATKIVNFLANHLLSEKSIQSLERIIKYSKFRADEHKPPDPPNASGRQPLECQKALQAIIRLCKTQMAYKDAQHDFSYNLEECKLTVKMKEKLTALNVLLEAGDEGLLNLLKTYRRSRPEMVYSGDIQSADQQSNGGPVKPMKRNGRHNKTLIRELIMQSVGWDRNQWDKYADRRAAITEIIERWGMGIVPLFPALSKLNACVQTPSLCQAAS